MFRMKIGQGKIGYIEAGGNAPRYGELEGWSINGEGNLVFNNNILQACPNSVDGAWMVWAAEFVDPAGNKGCLGFSPRSLPNDKPVSCVYS